MKLTVFHSDKGDCALLTGAQGANILVDGGMASSFRKHAAPALDRMRLAGGELDLVYISHIDQDHISGILRMLDDIVDWRVFHFHDDAGDNGFRAPDSPEPPVVRTIGHNAFHEQVGKNAGDIEDMLAANAARLSVDKKLLDVAELSGMLATSMAEAVKVSRRIGVKQLGIRLNAEFDGGLMFVTEPTDPIEIGSLRISVIGPFAEDLAALRKDWNKWLKSQKGKNQLRKIRERARHDEERLGASEFDTFVGPLVAERQELGDRNNVTAPNLASLMLLVEEDGHSALLTGDGHWEDILAGLDACGKLNDNGGIHVDMLKVQHHGSEHNTHGDFCRAVTADHYVFCADGSHENPDLAVVQAFIDSRLGDADARSDNAEVENRFTFWFNESPDRQEAKHPGHMGEVKRLVQRAVDGSSGQMKSRFLKGSSFELRLG